ncbi:jg23048 [Pararge aegeria aegeria]|uniref:Jg23048 protein n=1 Tax=Pararge aegeria aegeria TaxID=348720 RepID=A0A8S4S4G9_9NEOP|nr:jg23048 [Pararge aegeria aegeria]
MLGVSWTEFRTNNSILQEIGIKKRLSALVQSRILKFFGHVSRRESDSIERLVVQSKVEGTEVGRSGRSPMRWTDQIKSVVGGPLHEVHQAFGQPRKVADARGACDICPQRRSMMTTTTLSRV